MAEIHSKVLVIIYGCGADETILNELNEAHLDQNYPCSLDIKAVVAITTVLLVNKFKRQVDGGAN